MKIAGPRLGPEPAGLGRQCAELHFSYFLLKSLFIEQEVQILVTSQAFVTLGGLRGNSA